MTEQTLPIGIEGVMNGMPVPVRDHIGTRGKVAERLQAQLAWIRRPMWKCLRLRFQHQIIAVLQRTRHISAKRDFNSG
ncbi:hypothetical protein D3C72_2098970 [compost metagenome]